MSYYEIIADTFQATIHNIAMSVDDLAPPVENASQLITQALLQDHKILTCGNGVDAAQAQLFTTNLLSHFEQERPALPAFNLASDSASLTAIAQGNDSSEIFSRQIRALGQEGDVLLVINSGSESQDLQQAIEAAHERNMAVISLSNAADNIGGNSPLPGSVEIIINANTRPRIVELQIMVIHALCALTDHSLFGSYNQE